MFRKLTVLPVLLVLALGVLAVTPAAAQGNANWTGQYYNDPTLSNEVFRRTDNAIAFDWGTGSPDSRIDVDNFSVRWGTDISLPAGTYRFWALADDNVRVTVDFVSWRPVIDTFANSAVNQIVSGDVTLGSGSHHIQVDYREVTGTARVYVTWANLASNPSGPNFPAPAQQPIPVSAGAWTAQYFANASLSGSPNAIFSENSVNHDWGSGSPGYGLPADNFSVRWTSQQSLSGGRYQVQAQADDGVRVTVDGQTVINEWHNATGATYQVELNLPAGTHNFMVEYYEGGGNAFIHFDILLTNVAPPPGGSYPSVPVTGGTLTGNWLASYFNNTGLSGSPAAILTESSPSHNWGSGSPVASVLPDNFSARWTSTQLLTGGTYQLSVQADDGVRVYIDNVLWIDEWHAASAQTYTRSVTLAAGSHNFVVEYYEAGGLAFLNLSFGLGATVPPTQVPQQPSQSVATGSLRVTASTSERARPAEHWQHGHRQDQF